MPNVIKVCSKCKSTEIVKDAFAEWSVAEQTWVLHSVYDNTYCNSCEESCNLEDEEVCEEPSGSGVAP